MASDLQRLVESLGRRLSRSVAIDDPSIRLLAHSSHAAEVDDARVESIMRREVPAELVRHIQESGLFEATDLFTLPASPELGMSIVRIGMPIRDDRAVIGILWLLTSDGEVSEDEAQAVREAAEAASRLMHREHLLGELSRGRKRELMRDLISAEPRLCREAAERLIDEELVTTGPVTTLVVRVGEPGSDPLTEGERLALAEGMERARQPLPLRTSLQLDRPDHGIMAIVRSGTRREVEQIGADLHREVCARTGRAAHECQVGIGAERSSLADTRASYLEARRAADVAGVVRSLGPVAPYARLGVYALLAELPPDRLSLSLHPGLRRLIEADTDKDSLAHTLETYLDAAGSVQQTAARLHVHRTTVYYRLDRIQELVGVDLSIGADRLTLHLGIKVARLIGLHPDPAE